MGRVTELLDYGATALRPTWAQLPEPVRELVTERLGSDIVDAQSQGSGFTPGFASRLTCADGRRAFVKAASGAHAAIADCYRDEARIVAGLPSGLPVPALRWVSDDGDWIVLCFDDVAGRVPQRPWQRDNLERVLAVVTELADALSPAPPGLRVPTVHDALADDFSGWRSLAGAASAADLRGLFGDGEWIATHLDRLADLETGAVSSCAGQSLVHCDLRSDNVIITADGRTYVCDWNWPCLAAPWLDVVMLLPSAHADGYDADALLAAHPIGRLADAAAVNAVLAGLAGFFAVVSRRPEVPTSPALRRHQAAYGAATLSWLRARTGWS